MRVFPLTSLRASWISMGGGIDRLKKVYYRKKRGKERVGELEPEEEC